jgi:hypothetical protein
MRETLYMVGMQMTEDKKKQIHLLIDELKYRILFAFIKVIICIFIGNSNN